MKIPVVFKSFEGGQATDLKIGIKNSFAPTQGSGGLGTYGIDFRKQPSQFSVLPGTRREDTKVVNDLIQNEVMLPDGTIYAIGSGGSFYKRTTAGVWSLESGLSQGAYGMDFRKDTDAIYIPTKKMVSKFANATTSTPTMYSGIYGPSYSTYNNSANAGRNVAAYQTGSTKTTTLPTALNESDQDRRYFQSDIEPLTKISVFVVAKGTGNWTLTLHDGLDNTLATATVTNANLTNGTWNDFTFSGATNGQVRIYVAAEIAAGNFTGNARTYHFHLSSTVADGTVSSSTSNLLASCDVQIWADRLIQTTNGMHPMARFLQYEVVGNGNYLSIWEPISDPPTNDEWLRHRLQFPSEYEVCGIAVFNEYLAIACEKVTTDTTATPQDGIIFWWDGLSTTYNYFTRIPEGSPYGIHEYENVIYYYAGGAQYAIASPASRPVKIRTMPGTDLEYTNANTPIKVYPYSATVRRGIHLLGFPCQTTSTNPNFGVYSWGAVDKNWPNSFGLSYLISTGSTNYSAQNNLQIGMVKSFGDVLHISWRDDLNGGYGIDVIDNSSTPATSSSYESLIFDNGYPAKRKKFVYLQATFLTLPSDCSFKLKYKLDRASTWTYSSSFNSTNVQANNYARLDVAANQSYFYEMQVGVDITSGTTTPQFTSLTLVFDDNREERIGG